MPYVTVSITANVPLEDMESTREAFYDLVTSMKQEGSKVYDARFIRMKGKGEVDDLEQP